IGFSEANDQPVWPGNCYALCSRRKISRHISNFRKSLLPKTDRQLLVELDRLNRSLTGVGWPLFIYVGRFFLIRRVRGSGFRVQDAAWPCRCVWMTRRRTACWLLLDDARHPPLGA